MYVLEMVAFYVSTCFSSLISILSDSCLGTVCTGDRIFIPDSFEGCNGNGCQIALGKCYSVLKAYIMLQYDLVQNTISVSVVHMSRASSLCLVVCGLNLQTLTRKKCTGTGQLDKHDC